LAYSTPDTLHPSLLACPPSSALISEHLPENFNIPGSNPKRLEATAPAGGQRDKLPRNAPMTAKGGKFNRLEDEKDQSIPDA